MSVREYIGARYIPLFSDPIEWDNTKSYEPLTVVKYQGASYVSRQSVPEGVELSNNNYWLLWADYNAQLEQYRQEVLAFDERIDNLEADGSVTTNKIADEAVTTGKIEDAAITTAKLADDAVTPQKIDIDSLESTLNARKILWIGDSFSDPDTAVYDWVSNVSVNIGIPIDNIAYTGAGFLANGTNTFTNLLNTYINSHSASELSAITDVVIYGGNNDAASIYSNQAGIRSGATAVFTALQTHMPKAKIWLAIPNFTDSSDQIANEYIYLILTVLQSFTNINYKMINNVVYWQPLTDGYISSSNLHPNSAMLDKLVTAFASILNGGDANVYPRCSISFNSTYFSKNAVPLTPMNNVVNTGDYISAKTIANISASVSDLFTLQGCKSNLQSGFYIYSNNADLLGTCQVNQDGKTISFYPLSTINSGTTMVIPNQNIPLM